MTRPDGPEPSFADVMNGFSFDSTRSSRRRKRRREEDEEVEQVVVATPVEPVPPPDPLEFAPAGYLDAPEEARYEDTASSAVRPYAWTRGRTTTGYHLEIETLVSTSSRGREQLVLLPFEHRSVAELCEQARSVAEVAALLGVPLGVAKVLLGDMAGLGLVSVHSTVSGNGDVPDLALMERVLSGLRRL
ncbi:hypothetical protein GCM10023321_03280 [Pseudonocardia eucalypti]|uniref:DUF742 domain-containing protein n=1 Tax=Pseudonocardia eucalypti TaxID=648755 RepID=A0ABP9PIG0_9PSEU|nr:DNA-directed RNA polymerase specialized sigma24 family protein [Pseudonocardia eucalypti]